MAPNISSSPQAALHDFLLSHAEELGQLISLGRDQILFEADDVSEHIYLVKRGRIKVFIRNHSGDPIELAILSEGALIGEMSLLGESTRSASCIALDEIVELVSISRDIAMDVIEADPSIRHALIVILTQRARDMVRFIHDFSGLTSLVSDGN